MLHWIADVWFVGRLSQNGEVSKYYVPEKVEKPIPIVIVPPKKIGPGRFGRIVIFI